MDATRRFLHAPDERETLLRGPVGALLAVGGEETAGSVSIVEHPLGPRALGAFVHTHANEDEYSYVLEGTVGFELGGESFDAAAGSLVVKPRGIPHAFWNPTDEPARILEVIVPAGFERYFVEIDEILSRPGPPDLAALHDVAARYDLKVDLDSIPRLAAAHGLNVG